jgi:hypothetical protein
MPHTVGNAKDRDVCFLLVYSATYAINECACVSGRSEITRTWRHSIIIRILLECGSSVVIVTGSAIKIETLTRTGIVRASL